MILRLLAAIALAIVAMLVPRPALAQAFSCQVDATPALDFGRPGSNPTGQIDSVATPTLRVTCTGWYSDQVKICVGINGGSPDTSTAPRRMTHTTNNNAKLDYQIYGDPSRTQVIGPMAGLGGAGPIELTATLSQQVFGIFGRATVDFPINGRIPSGQSGLTAGTYQSTLNVEIDSVAATGSCRNATGRLANTSMTVRAMLAGNCTIIADDLTFGSHSALTANIDSSSQIALTCTTGTVYSVSLNGGTVAANVASRRMGLNGSPTGAGVGYQLYTAASRSAGEAWGDGSGGTVKVQGTGTGTPRNMTVWGRVYPQTTPTAGTYQDVVTATVTY